MTISELQLKFLYYRDYLTDDVNELLDFAKKAYIDNEISILEYRSYIQELEKRGATSPEIFMGHSFTH